MHRMRKEMIELKDANRLLSSKVNDMVSSAVRPAPRVQSAHASNQPNA